ncbi:MAG: hypothetical protein PHU49_11440 [Syntrophorhabdaceae bacterium]|nr:hypothetical protein [Syntrophorhabdaceae bacterium]MDD5244617.1 hypothetical protein [Syntrophorhabdaceae bacterium]
MFYEDVFRGLNKAKIRFAVTGGVAMVLYGGVRLTVDLDLIVCLRADNLEKFIAALDKLGYKPKLPVDGKAFLDPAMRSRWAEEKNMVVFSFHRPDKPMNLIDVFIREPIDFDEIEKELVWFEAADLRIPVISKRHLKQLKSSTHREQDAADIRVLESMEEDKDKNG